jgi:hypothetical protein
VLLAACAEGGGPGDGVPKTGSTATTAPAAGALPPPSIPPPTSTPATGTAGGLAARLSEVEAAIRDPATPAARLAALGHSQQRAYRALVRRPRLLPEVLRLVPPGLRGSVRANALAGAELRKLSGPPRKRRLPRWRIVPPRPAAELLAEYRGAEAALGVDWEYLAAIHVVETRVGRIRGTSSAGAQGPMQFLPSTWRRYGAGGDIGDVHDAVLAAARLLRANGAPADMAAALYSYNPSRRYVRAVTAYARQMQADPRAFLGYHSWQVYFGDVLLPEGYPARRAVPDAG